MTVYIDNNNPQEVIIAGRNADGQIVEMGTILVSHATVSGAEVATIAITAADGVTLAGVTPPATLTFD